MLCIVWCLLTDGCYVLFGLGACCLFVVCCSVVSVRCLLLVFVRVVGCRVLCVVVWCLFVVCCLLFACLCVVCLFSLRIARCLMCGACCLLFVACCLLFVCLLFVG